MTEEINHIARAAASLGDPCAALIELVEGITGSMNHGTWRDDKGRRLKDTREWVAFYAAARAALAAASQPAEPDIRKTTEAMVDAAFKALPADAHGTIGSGEMYRVLDAALAAAPQPAPEDREALVEVIAEARGHFTPREMAWAGNGYHDEDRAIADALLARGLRLSTPETELRRCAECDCEGGEHECNWIKPGPSQAEALQQLADLGQAVDRHKDETEILGYRAQDIARAALKGKETP